MTVDLTNKVTVHRYIDTMVDEAGRYFRYAQGETVQIDSTLRPYKRDMRSTAVAAGTFSVATLLAKISAVFHLRNQARLAAESLSISTKYQTAALVLNAGYHSVLKQLDNVPSAKVSNKIWELAKKVTEIDGMRNSEATQYLYCGVSSLVSLTTLAIGLFAPNPKIVKIGLTALMGTALLYVYTKLTHLGDQKKIQTLYSEIGASGEDIRHDLCFYSDNMQLQLGYGSAYNPMFAAFAIDHKQAAITADLSTTTYPAAK